MYVNASTNGTCYNKIYSCFTRTTVLYMYFILLQVQMQAEYIKDSALKIWCPEISKFFNFQTSKVCMITWYDLFNHLKFVLVKK